MTPIGLLLSILASTAAFALWKLISVVYHELTSPFRHLPGPKCTSFIYGSILDIFMAAVQEDSGLQHQWVKQYGKTLRYKESFLTNRLFTMDTCAINHVLHSIDYQKPSYIRYSIAQMLGTGLLYVEGVQHPTHPEPSVRVIPPSTYKQLTDYSTEVPTFLVAGHETTSTATTWALYAMALAPDIQTKLREELISVDTETPSMEDLMALPYLDAVVRETLRLYTPFPNIVRVAMKDDVIPLEQPFTDKSGVLHHGIRIRKGDLVLIPILAMNTSEELWGDDAHEFKPERWDNIPEAISRIPGLWSHLLTFFGGPRSCIGYRFALVQMKVVLFTLVRAFEFELAVPASEIGKHSLVMLRPFLRGDPTKKPQLPLLFKPYQRE
ncbi:cytochrome P450 [Melanogaster broomeanus]|nr:cytochrome P450 [Melanogaster broomeanus]